jgi:hypothetical protein
MEHIEDECVLRPDRLLDLARIALGAISQDKGAGALSRARKRAEALLPRIEQCLRRAPWTDRYKP